jgi:hypothetical protein
MLNCRLVQQELEPVLLLNQNCVKRKFFASKIRSAQPQCFDNTRLRLKKQNKLNNFGKKI